MAQITGFEIINGKKSKKYEYLQTVFNQQQIEQHRDKLADEFDTKAHDSIVCFHLRLHPQEIGLMHS